MPLENAKDVMISILGGAVALAGLLLIFCGFLFSQASAFPKDTTPDDVIDRFRNAGRTGLIPFVFSLLLAGGSLTWFACQSAVLYRACFFGFLLLLLGTGVYGAIVLLGYL